MMDAVDVSALSVVESPLTEKDLELCKQRNPVRYWPNTPFPIDEEINRKVFLYDGDIELVKADALVNPTNENLSQMNLANKLAGPELEVYVRRRIKACPTGDVRISPGFESNFKHIIHAVPPKYQPKYKTAAETALFHTYFRILESMIERKIRTVVMPILTTTKCNLPIDDNCNLQLRIIRRIIEKKRHDFDKIVIHVQNEGDHYTLPFYCYFPRSKLDEEIACYKFTSAIGGPNGEPVIPEREIRIKSKPAILGLHDDRSIDLTSGLDLSTVVGKTQFCKMQDDLDKLRRDPSVSSANQAVAANRNIFRGCNIL